VLLSPHADVAAAAPVARVAEAPWHQEEPEPQQNDDDKDQERALVESVNDMIGAAVAAATSGEKVEGRQTQLAGADILSDAVDALPGRPNLEPLEGSSLGASSLANLLNSGRLHNRNHHDLPHHGHLHHDPHHGHDIHHGHHDPHHGHLAASVGHGRHHDCCLFVFFDGSAYYFDDYLRALTGLYRLMYGTVNGHPHYVARDCAQPERYGGDCSYIWNSG